MIITPSIIYQVKDRYTNYEQTKKEWCLYVSITDDPTYSGYWVVKTWKKPPTEEQIQEVMVNGMRFLQIFTYNIRLNFSLEEPKEKE